MKIFDAHMHFSNVQAFYGAADESGVDYSYHGFVKEREEAGIVGCICMGLVETSRFAFPDKTAQTPMFADLAERPPNFFTCLGINPYTLNDDAVERIRKVIKTDPTIVGFKIYAGYYHYYVHDPIYAPIYNLAAEHGLTVAIHTGDTYSEQGLLEYSHPLAADRVAVAFRDTKFLLCHMGDPWIMDACEVAYKNRNVYLDISGLLAGDEKLVAATEKRQLVMQHYSQGLVYLNNYKRAVFGTDWPIAPLKAYVEFCKKIVPEHTYEDVFYNNAFDVYEKIKI
ncbi:MAG: amidohydrolase family protein [Firmicutes bacterium]|nr:amidohydrolase family protein [Bacillota bacterium]